MMQPTDTTMMPAVFDQLENTAFYTVEKDYQPSDLKLSATFRQWRADSHCQFIHGYALGIKLGFGCSESNLDKNGWVIDFGSLKPIKSWLGNTFDHTTLVAEDDPELMRFRGLSRAQIIQLVEVPRVGCEGFAKYIFDYVAAWLHSPDVGNDRNVQLLYVTVYEHGANSATYSR